MTYFCEMRYLLSLIAALMLMSGCRKTEDITATMQPAIDNATAFQSVAAHAFLPTAEVLRDWGNSRANVPFLMLTDSGVWFDFKTGIVCPDGLIRSGKCLVKNGFSLNNFEDTIWFSASPADSFAVISSAGPVYFSGKLKFTHKSAYQLSVNGNADIRTRDKQFPVSIDGLIELDPEGQNTRSAKFKTSWFADVVLAGKESYHYEVTRTSDCFPSFSLGSGHSYSNAIQINFNPFSNAACDPVVKFTSGREEWLADLW
jgi:hypothetical protein